MAPLPRVGGSCVLRRRIPRCRDVDLTLPVELHKLEERVAGLLLGRERWALKLLSCIGRVYLLLITDPNCSVSYGERLKKRLS